MVDGLGDGRRADVAGIEVEEKFCLEVRSKGSLFRPWTNKLERLSCASILWLIEPFQVRLKHFLITSL